MWQLRSPPFLETLAVMIGRLHLLCATAWILAPALLRLGLQESKRSTLPLPDVAVVYSASKISKPACSDEFIWLTSGCLMLANARRRNDWISIVHISWEIWARLSHAELWRPFDPGRSSGDAFRFVKCMSRMRVWDGVWVCCLSLSFWTVLNRFLKLSRKNKQRPQTWWVMYFGFQAFQTLSSTEE